MTSQSCCASSLSHHLSCVSLMDEQQLEAYRRRMQERYLSERPTDPVPAEEDAAFAKQLQEQEFASATTSDEDLARKLQHEEAEAEVRPPLDIQREERLVDPEEFYPEAETKPLLSTRREGCWTRTRRLCRKEPCTAASAALALATLAGGLVLSLILYLR